MIARHAIHILVIILLLAVPGMASGQNYNPFNERDDKYRLLGLKRAKETFEVARRDFERQKELFNRKLITQAQLDRAHSVFADAEVNYQQSLLAVMFEQQFVSVTEAIKYQGADGAKHVRVTLSNTSGGSAELLQLAEVEDDMFRALQPDRIHNVYVSVLNDDGAIVSRPYEAKINELRFGEPQTLDFVMLQDLDEVTVNVIYSNGSERSLKIFLQKDATVDRVAMQSEQFAQEVDLGGSTSFDLTLELFSGSRDPYALVCLNLPEQINRYFIDASGQVRLRQVRFTETSQSKEAALSISLPDRPTSVVSMDQPISFFVAAISADRLSEIESRLKELWSEDEIQALECGYVRLEVIPRGRGELLVRAPILFHSIQSDEDASMTIDFVNEGTDRIDNVEVEADLPLGWQRAFEPNSISKLEIAEEKRMTARFMPPAGVSEGKYDIRLRISGMSNNQPITVEDKTVSIEIRPDTNIAGTSLLVLLILGVVGGMVVFGVRLSRR